jgi:hypothetical protein
MGKCTKKVCSILGVTQEFIPSFMHHCLSACERTHRTLAERLTLYLQENHQWEEAHKDPSATLEMVVMA